MRSRATVLVAVAALAVAPFMAASASESVLVGDADFLQLCADAAGKAVSGKVPADRSFGFCDAAVEAAKDRRDELAAAYVNRSALDLAAARYDAALADSNAAIRIKPIIPEAHLNLGIALSAENRNAEAVRAFTDALAREPSRPEIVYFDRAMSREDSGDMKGAYLDYRKAAQLAPAWDMPKQQLARFTVAHAPLS